MSDLLSAVRSRIARRSPRRRRAEMWASVYCEVCDVERRPIADGGADADASE